MRGGTRSPFWAAGLMQLANRYAVGVRGGGLIHSKPLRGRVAYRRICAPSGRRRDADHREQRRMRAVFGIMSIRDAPESARHNPKRAARVPERLRVSAVIERYDKYHGTEIRPRRNGLPPARISAYKPPATHPPPIASRTPAAQPRAPTA